MKYLITLLFTTAVLISCNNSNEKKMNETNNEKLVKQYFEHFNNHDWVKMAAMYTENAEFKDPTLGQGIVKQTQKQIIEKYKGLSEMFPNVKDKVIKIYPSGDNHMIIEFISSGTAPDNSKFELPICTIFTIENGKITQDFTYFDNFGE